MKRSIKLLLGANERISCLPTEGEVKHAFIAVRDSHKPRAAGIAKQLIDLGFKILATDGTFKVISDAGLECERDQVTEGRPNVWTVFLKRRNPPCD